MARNDQQMPKSQSTYQKIFGGRDDSIAGPIFFLLIGILSVVVFLLLSSIGVNPSPGIISERTDAPYQVPLLNMLMFLAGMSAFLGIPGGIIGILWFFLQRYRKKNREQRMMTIHEVPLAKK